MTSYLKRERNWSMTWYLKQKRHSLRYVFFLNQKNTGLTMVSEAGKVQVFDLVSKARENQVYAMVSEA